MAAFRDRTGDIYGRLTVVGHAGRDHRKKHIWLCKCECGGEKVVVGDNLSSGKSKSCGCLKSEFLSRSGNQYGIYNDRESALLKVQYSHLRRRNGKISSDECMSFDDFSTMSKKPCRYCGIPFSKEIEDRLDERAEGKRLSDHVLKCNGIDRIDSSQGYTLENSVPCCKFCNFAKHTMTEYDFLKWIKKVYEYNYT